MDRMKTFLKYFLMVVAFYIFSNLVISGLLKVTYTDIRDYEINVTQAFVDVTEARTSKRNGYVNGIVKNNTNQIIENKYLKFSMLSKNGNVLGEKYVKVEKLEPGELRKYEVKYDYDNVKTFKIEMVDTKPEEVDFFELVKDNAKDLMSKKVI